MSPYTHATHFMTDNINGTSPRCRMKQKRSMIRLTTTATRTEGGLPVLKVSNESPNNELTCDHEDSHYFLLLTLDPGSNLVFFLSLDADLFFFFFFEE